MSDHPFVPLPAGSSLGKSFEYGIDINLGTTAAPVWQPLRRISEFQPTYPATTTDVASYDDRGAPNEDINGRGFSLAFTMQVNRSLTTGLALAEAEKIFAASKGIGSGAVVEVRWYHKPDAGTPNPNDSFTGFATVEVTRQNTGNADAEWWSVTLAGKGKYVKITNPFAGWSVTTPAITAITPAGAVAGKAVTIVGTGFLGASSVKFATTEVTDKVVVNGSTIIAVMPAGTAGSVAVTVVTPGGTSAAFNYTRGA